MNVLFVLHNDMNCNSASHVDGVARELAERGHDCVVTVPDPVPALTTARLNFCATQRPLQIVS